MANHGGLETLWGKIDPRTFQDRAVESHPRRNDDGVLIYRPRTQETRAAYDALLDVINHQLGNQPPDVLAGAADEILRTLNDDEFTSDPVGKKKKKKEIEKLLYNVSDETFHHLVSIGERITDFDDDHQAQPPEDYHLGTDQFAAVEFAADSDDDHDFHQVHEDTHNSSDQSLQAVNVRDIDAYWLQRKMWHALDCIEDPQRCHDLSEEILKVLAAEGDDDRDVENRLVVLFDYGRFDLVRFLRRNRHEIVWCTRLARAAEDHAQRNKIEEKMKSDPRFAPILELLYEARALLSAKHDGAAAERR